MTTPAFLHPFARPARPADQYVTMVGGAGAEVWDRDGRRYVDGMASLWYCNAGYGRVEIADAARAQMVALAAFSCFEPFTNEPADELAELIATIAPVPDSRVFFTSSGSEAVDSAIKLARIAHVRAGHPERTVIISRDRAYHGVTYGGMSAQGLPLNKEGFGPHVEGVVNLPADDIEAVAAYLAEHGDGVAAILTEPVQGAGGVYPPPEGYLAGLRRLADQHGCYLIFDEVICGFGRLGRWFGGEHFGVRADLTTFAKAVTSGYVPLGGVVVAPSVRRAARGRRDLAAAPRPHLLRPPDRLRGRTGQPPHPEGGGPRRAGRGRGAAPLRGLRGHRRRRAAGRGPVRGRGRRAQADAGPRRLRSPRRARWPPAS